MGADRKAYERSPLHLRRMTYYETYMYGYNYGKLGAEGKASGDRAGDCEIDSYTQKKHDICEKGRDAGWDSVPKAKKTL